MKISENKMTDEKTDKFKNNRFTFNGVNMTEIEKMMEGTDTSNKNFVASTELLKSVPILTEDPNVKINIKSRDQTGFVVEINHPKASVDVFVDPQNKVVSPIVQLPSGAEQNDSYYDNSNQDKTDIYGFTSGDYVSWIIQDSKDEHSKDSGSNFDIGTFFKQVLGAIFEFFKNKDYTIQPLSNEDYTKAIENHSYHDLNY